MLDVERWTFNVSPRSDANPDDQRGRAAARAGDRTGRCARGVAAGVASARARESASCCRIIARSARTPRSNIRETGITVDVRVGTKTYVAEFLTGRTAGGVQLFYVRCDEFFDRAGIYGEHGVAYEDNASRFIFFSKAALELARRLTPSPQILHVHDWAAALVPLLVRDAHMPFRTVLTIHHLAEQGSFWGLDFSLTNLPGALFHAARTRVFRAHESAEGRHPFRRSGDDGERAVSARDDDGRKAAAGSTSCCASRRTKSARSERRRLSALGSGDGYAVAGRVQCRANRRQTLLPRDAARQPRACAESRPDRSTEWSRGSCRRKASMC